MMVLTVLLFTLAYGSGDTEEISKENMKSVLSNHAFIRRRIFPSIVVEEYVLKNEKNADKRFDNYNEAFARRVMFPISAAAYSSDPFECLNETLGLEKDIRRLFSYEWRSGQCSGYVAQLRPYSAIALGFRGMEARDQLVQRAIDTLKTPWSKWEYGGQVSDYFNNAFHKIWSGLEDHLYNYVNEHPNWDIWISGHSVGGALATLAAAFLVQSGYIEDPKKVKLVTFGQPRVGDKEFAENFDKMGIYDYRVVHWRDVVPALLLSGYWHHGKEIFYDAGMMPGQFSTCEIGDSLNCSNTDLSTSDIDHQVYFGEVVSEYGKRGCKR